MDKFNNFDVVSTDHGKKRLKERLNIKYGSAIRHLKKVVSNGEFIKSTKEAIIQVLYKNVCYVFNQNKNYHNGNDQLVLVTIKTNNVSQMNYYKGGKAGKIDMRPHYRCAC